MFFDLPLEQLEMYRPERNEPTDFDQFWADTLAQANLYPLAAQFQLVPTGLKLVQVYDLTFNGYGGQPIKGWFILPRHFQPPLPCVVEYIGYGGGRGLPIDWLLWANAGYAHLVMDSRGQGSVWAIGDTPDPDPAGTPQIPGFMTRGILSPATYYYRRLFTDAVRAVQAARAHPAVNSQQIIVTGGSQGGGITLAVAGLVPDLAAAMPNVPFLCQFRRATAIVDSAPYNEISQFCRRHRHKIETVFTTLSYFDGLNFSGRATCPALFSVGLMDEVCPPSTVFAAYNHYAGRKQITVWPYNHHEGGESFQASEQLKFLAALQLSPGD